MNEIWQLAKREVVERRLVFLVAAVLGLVAPVLTTVVKIEPIVGSLALAVGLGHGVALLVGASTINRATREGRLSFFFNRPVRAGSVWWGKLLGVVLLGLGVQVVVVLPGYLWERLSGSNLVDAEAIFFASCAGLLGSVLVGHVGGTIIGSRSKFTLVDLGALVFVVVTVWTAWQRLRLSMADSALFWLLILIAGAGFLGALLGGWLQVRRGRVDQLRSHRALSLVLWASVVSAALLGWGFSDWVLDVHPDEMTLEAVVAGSETPWFASRHVVFAGDLSARNRVAAQFLTQAETGQWHLLDVGPAGHLPARLSRNAEIVAWTTHNRDGVPRSTAWIAKRSAGGIELRRELPMFVADETAHWELSPNGDRIVDVHFAEDPANTEQLNLRVRIWDVATGRPEAEEWVQIPMDLPNWRPNTRLFWDDDDTVRLFVEAGRELILWRFTKARAFEEVARLSVGDEHSSAYLIRTTSGSSGGVGVIAFSPGGEQVLVGSRSRPASPSTDRAREPGEDEPSGSRVGPPDTVVSFSLYDHVLGARLWDLEPFTARIWNLDLRGNRVIVRFTAPWKCRRGGAWDGGSETCGEGGPGVRLGGPDGWSPQHSTFNVPVWSGLSSTVMRSLPIGSTPGFEKLDLLTGQRSPIRDGLQEVLLGFSGLPYQEFYGVGFLGGQRRHESMDDLLFHLPAEDGLERPALVRVDFDAGTVESLYR